VLLPGGTFLMGAQRSDVNLPNYDEAAGADEVLHEVTLAPFFLARHELTQGQWSRLCTWSDREREPSRERAGQTNYLGGRITWSHPVETVDWVMCDQLLTRHGLVLPTEAQWEYGCRAGTTTPWFVPRERLLEVANLADATVPGSTGWKYESWRDGHVLHAPVGSFQPNGFGLFDVHGNVFEWCRDSYGAYGSERAGDGLRPGARSPYRCYRGGSFNLPAGSARSALRDSNTPSLQFVILGVRPARSITH
jgi:formylglycine-generating enzyme required for sulfatase activity